MFKKAALFFSIAIISLILSCKKDPGLDPGTESGSVSFSADTVTFDTVFTRVGSVTKRFQIYNHSDSKLIISKVRLGKGNASYFRMNIDGRPGKELSNVEIGANDSVYAFVEVTVDPNNSLTPFVISDSIIFQTQTNVQSVQLVAWGQDAYFHYPKGGGYKAYVIDTTSASITWDNKKPHVIYGAAVIDSLQTLTIQAGTKIYFYNNAQLIVYNAATLKVEGTKASPVLFRGTRLETIYSDIPSQWYRIWIYPGSVNNKIDYAIIENSVRGLQVSGPEQGTPTTTTLTLSNSIVRNTGFFALYGENAKIKSTNCVFANSDQFLTYLYGGDYEFLHCTFANFSFSGRQSPSIAIVNFYKASKESPSLVKSLSKADFKNCIIYGNSESEIDTAADPSVPFSFLFDHCLIKVDPDKPTNGPNYVSILKNPAITSDSTIFVSPYKGNFQLSSGSIAIGQGDPAIGALVPTDLLGNTRDSAPDLGAYEKK